VVYRGKRGESLCDVAEILSAKVASQVLHSNRGDRQRLVSSFGYLGEGCSLGIAIVPCQIRYACRYSRDFRAHTTLDPRVLFGPDSETLAANMRGVNTLFLNGFLFFRVYANLCVFQVSVKQGLHQTAEIRHEDVLDMRVHKVSLRQEGMLQMDPAGAKYKIQKPLRNQERGRHDSSKTSCSFSPRRFDQHRLLSDQARLFDSLVWMHCFAGFMRLLRLQMELRSVCAFSAKHNTQVENEPEQIQNIYYVCFVE
jgi:hypothetical protein